MFTTWTMRDQILINSKSRLQAALREYPFGEHLKLLQDQLSDDLVRDSSDDYEGLMTTIGSILRKGSSEELKLLVLSIRRNRGEATSPSIAFPKPDVRELEKLKSSEEHTESSKTWAGSLRR